MLRNKLLKKLFNLSALNSITAGLNFLFNFVIVEFLSLKILGEFTTFSAYIAFGGLFYSFIPANYSVFKWQDDERFEKTLMDFFVLASILFLGFSACLNLLIFPNLNFVTICLFGITTFFLSFFDIMFQAKNFMKKYFILLFLISSFKLSLILLFSWSGIIQNLDDVLLVSGISQLLILSTYFYREKINPLRTLQNPKEFKNSISFFVRNFSTFKPYYLNTILKRVRTNSIVILFSRVVSPEILGLFALFTKVSSFVLGLSKTFEAFFMNRENIHKFKNNFSNKSFPLAAILQLIYIVVGSFYLRFISGEYYFIEILTQSFLVYPHIYFLLARAQFLSEYSNKEANVSETLYIIIVLIGFTLAYFSFFNPLYLLLTTFMIATIGLQLYMILQTTALSKKL